MYASFKVGDLEKHVVGVYFSSFGLEVYTVDGFEVLRQWSFSIRGTRRFVVGDREKHEVEIVVDLIPSVVRWWNSEWVAKALIDGEVVVDDLTPGLRTFSKACMRVVNWSILGAAAGFVSFWLLFDSGWF